MNLRVVERREWTPEHPKQHAAILKGTDEPTTLVDAESGRIVAVQLVLGDDGEDLRREIARWLRLGVEWTDGNKPTAKEHAGGGRLSGIRYANRVFGNLAPSPLRKRWGASSTDTTSKYPELNALLDQMVADEWEKFNTAAPEDAAAHDELVRADIDADWLLADAPFTSGIINNTAALPYHRDKGNIAGSWSAMVAIRKNVGGGGLDLPEYGITLGVPDSSLTLFDGQGTWHGVTPLTNERSNAYRFTLVSYAKSGFVGIGGCAENIETAKRRATRP